MRLCESRKEFSRVFFGVLAFGDAQVANALRRLSSIHAQGANAHVFYFAEFEELAVH